MAKVYIKFDKYIILDIYFSLESYFSVTWVPLSTKYLVFDASHPAIKVRDRRGPVGRSLMWRWLCGGCDKPPDAQSVVTPNFTPKNTDAEKSVIF